MAKNKIAAIRYSFHTMTRGMRVLSVFKVFKGDPRLKWLMTGFILSVIPEIGMLVLIPNKILAAVLFLVINLGNVIFLIAHANLQYSLTHDGRRVDDYPYEDDVTDEERDEVESDDEE